jgi:hypothetical protein
LCKLYPEASTELHNMMQSSHFHHTSENGLTIFPDNTKTQQSITFPADGVLITINYLVEGELECFHCTEALSE